MKYLVKAKVKESKRAELIQEIRDGTLGSGSVAFGEYIKNMEQARILDDGIVCWIEICFCPTPLNEENHIGKNTSKISQLKTHRIQNIAKIQMEI